MKIFSPTKALRSQHHRFSFIFSLFLVIFTLFFFLPVQNAYSLDITFAWDEVMDENLAGYRLFCREEGQDYNYAAPAWEGTDSNCTIYDLDGNTNYYFVARAFDFEDNESDDSNEVYYSLSENMPPNANAGPDQTVNEADTVTLDGSNSNDFDGSITAYLWTQTSGRPVALSGSTITQPTFTAPYVGSDGESLIFQLTVTDNDGSQSTDSCTVNVSDSIMNLAPKQPIINSPSDGATECELMPQITTALYSDPENDPHSQSRWQISKQSGFFPLVLDITSTEHLTELTVPHLVLESDTTYYVRVQFLDAFSAPSVWSDAIEFSTNSEVNDLNVNGIPDEKEVSDYIDLNGDWTNDNDQPDVIKCITLPDDNNTIIGINKDSESITAIEALDTIDPSIIPESTDKPIDLSFGLFSFRLLVNESGATARIRIYFSEDISQATNFYKFDTIHGWQECTENITFNEDGRSITITVEDGGFGDSDGVANGIIVDPGGLVTYTISTDTISTGNSDNASKSVGCFISTLGDFTNSFAEHYQNP